MAKEGSITSGLMDSFATAISMALQYGVPLKVLCNKFTHARFEPSGFTNNKQIPYAKSIMDYIFRWLALKFLPKEEIQLYMDEKFADSATGENTVQITPPVNQVNANSTSRKNIEEMEKKVFINQADAPNCYNCGNIMVRNGSCHKCLVCGATSGCS
ncbi:MAG: hypothetical protein ACE5GL_05845 [Calditrichia bacterium]